MTRTEELNKKINPQGMICGKNWYGAYSIQGSWEPKKVENGQIKGIHANLADFDTLAEMETYISSTWN